MEYTLDFIDAGFLSKISQHFGDGEYVNYLNVYSKENKKWATKNVASMVTQIRQDVNNLNINNYINISINSNVVVGAPVASMVMHSSNKRGPPGHPGSIPGWGATTINVSDFILKPVIEIYEVFIFEEEIYFIDSENTPVMIKSITKEDFQEVINEN